MNWVMDFATDELSTEKYLACTLRVELEVVEVDGGNVG